MLQLSLDVHLDASAQFKNFFLGRNRQIFSRLINLDVGQAECIIIWGSEGCGKSHLAQALCRKISESDAVATYLPLDYPGLEPSVMEGLEFADLVCLDAIESVAGDSGWEEAIFHLLNQIKSKQKSLVIFAQNAPQAGDFKLPDLESRLNAMEIYKLASLSEADKPQFLQQCAKDRGLVLPDEVITYLLSRATRDTKGLIQLIQKLDAESLAHQRKLTIPFIKKRLDW